MTEREKLFIRWMALKDDIQNLAGIVKNYNPAMIAEENTLAWLEETTVFVNKLNQLKLDTLKET